MCYVMLSNMVSDGEAEGGHTAPLSIHQPHGQSYGLPSGNHVSIYIASLSRINKKLKLFLMITVDHSMPNRRTLIQ